MWFSCCGGPWNVLFIDKAFILWSFAIYRKRPFPGIDRIMNLLNWLLSSWFSDSKKCRVIVFFLYLFCTDKHAIDVFKQRIELLSLCDNPSTSWSLEWMEKQWMNRNCGSFVTQRYGKTVIIIYRMSVQSTWIHSENDLYWINQPLYPYYYHIVDMFLNENSIPLIHFYYYSSYIFFFHFIISLLFWYLSIFSMSLNVI